MDPDDMKNPPHGGETEIRMVMDDSPALVSYIDENLRYRMVDDGYARLLGHVPGDMIGKTPEDILDPAAYSFARPLMDRALTGEAVKFVRHSVTAEGRRLLVSVTFIPDIEETAAKGEASSGCRRGFYVLFGDRGALIQAEGAREASDRRFRDIVEASSDWFWEMDADLRISYLSENAADVGGIDVGKLIGHTPWGLFDEERKVPGMQSMRQHFETRDAFRDFRCSYTGGSDRSFHVISVNGIPVFDEAGKFAGYRGSVRDITRETEAIKEKERMEGFFFGALELLPVSIVLYNPDDVMIYCNATFRSIAKNAGWDVGVGTTFEGLQRVAVQCGSMVDAVGREEEWIAEVLERHRLSVGESSGGYRICYRWLDGSEHWSEAYRARTDDGHTLVSHMDVTDKVQQEEQLRQAQKMEAVGQLTGGIAHDFNNILAVVLGNLDLLMERASEHEDLGRLASRAIKAAERGAMLTQRLLAFSRRQPLEPVPTDVNALVQGVDDLLRQALGEQNELEFVRAAGLWRCEVDPLQVENAILNLAINARDAMVGGGKLTIETANAHLDDEYAAAQVDVTPGQYVMIAITDTGSGMEQGVRSRIFEPFFTTKDVGQGSGLGLSMVYGFVKQSKGHIAVYSEPGEGTSVRIYLPRASAQDQAAPPAAVDFSSLSGEGRRILLVEDEQLVRELTRDLLEELDYRAIVADSGPAALEALEAAPSIDLLLTDAVLPGGMNGRGLAEEVVRRRPGVRVLYMSGYTENAIIHHGRLDRDAILLQKPFRKKDLAAKLREALSREPPDRD